MNLLLSQYPVTREYLERLSSAIGGPLEPVAVSTITAKGYRDIYDYFRELRAEVIYLPVFDQSSRPFVPMLQLLAVLTRSRRRFVIEPDFSIHEFGYLDALIGGVRMTWGGFHGLLTVIAAHSKLSRLLRAPRIIVRGGGPNSAIYLKTSLWLGIQAGGSVAHTAGVVGALLRRGYEVKFASAETPVSLPENDALQIINVTPRSAFVVPRELNHYRHNDSFVEALSPACRDGAEFVYQRLSLGNYAGVALSRRFNLPLIVEHNGSEGWLARNWGTPLLMERLASRAENACLRHAHLVVTVSNVLKDELVSRGVEADRIVAVPNGVDANEFDSNRFSAEEIVGLRKRYGIPADALVVTFVGTFGPWHGAEVLAQTAREMAATAPEWLAGRKLHFMFVGDGARRIVVEAVTAEPATRKCVTITGLIDHRDIPLHLAASDIFVSPHVRNPDRSPFFGSPIKLFEYLAAGRPVIASDLNQIGEILAGCPHIGINADGQNAPVDGACGVLVKPNDVHALAQAVKFLAENPEWREAAGRNARLRALERHTWDKHLKAILAGLQNAQTLERTAARRPVRLLFNGLHSKSGGGVTYLRNILPLLAEDPGLEVHLCLHGNQRGLLPDNLENVIVHYLDFTPGFWHQQVREQIDVPRLARRIDADVTFSPANYGPLAAPNSVVLLRNAMGVAFVERRPTKIAYWALVYLGTFLSLLVACRAITVSEYAQRTAAVGPIGWLHKRFTVVPHGVSPMFSPPASGAKRDDFLLAVSDIYVQKNFTTLIAAMAQLQPKHPGIVLKIAGYPNDADHFAALKRMIASEKLDDRVEFLGRIGPEILLDLYRRCRAFVFPSTVETFGNPLVEAMACGAPIACSNSAAMPEVVGDAAVFFDPRDVADMAAAIDRLLSDPGLCQRLARKAVERARDYSWQRTAERTGAVIKEAAAR